MRVFAYPLVVSPKFVAIQNKDVSETLNNDFGAVF